MGSYCPTEAQRSSGAQHNPQDLELTSFFRLYFNKLTIDTINTEVLIYYLWLIVLPKRLQTFQMLHLSTYLLALWA